MASGLQKAIERHEKWWLGKYIRRADCPNSPFKKVVKVETYGNPSFVYGYAEFTFEDGTRSFASYSDVYRPRKKDWEVSEAVEQKMHPTTKAVASKSDNESNPAASGG